MILIVRYSHYYWVRGPPVGGPPKVCRTMAFVALWMGLGHPLNAKPSSWYLEGGGGGGAL